MAEAPQTSTETTADAINNNNNNNNSPLQTEAGSKDKNKSRNKGTGAGGKKTNLNGKLFESKTNNCARLLQTGFVPMVFVGTQSVQVSKDQWEKKKSRGKYDFLLKQFAVDGHGHGDDSEGSIRRSEVFVLQSGMKRYMLVKYGIQMFRCPDEAYIIETDSGSGTTRVVVKILEKKEQRVQGSVETKLWSGPSLKREYELVLQPKMKPGYEVEVHYGFCISAFLADKMKATNEEKYVILNTILGENNIAVLFGDDANYFERLDAWTALEPGNGAGTGGGAESANNGNYVYIYNNYSQSPESPSITASPPLITVSAPSLIAPNVL
jgi:hypothetical protein